VIVDTLLASVFGSITTRFGVMGLVLSVGRRAARAFAVDERGQACLADRTL
jgi:hypothetical protein